MRTSSRKSAGRSGSEYAHHSEQRDRPLIISKLACSLLAKGGALPSVKDGARLRSESPLVS